MRNHTHPFAINSLSNKQTGESHTHTYSRRLAHTLPHTHKQTCTHTHTGTLARYTHACHNTQSSFHYKTEVHRSSSSSSPKHKHTHTHTAWRWAGKTTKNRKILWQKLHTHAHTYGHTRTHSPGLIHSCVVPLTRLPPGEPARSSSKNSARYSFYRKIGEQQPCMCACVCMCARVCGCKKQAPTLWSTDNKT